MEVKRGGRCTCSSRKSSALGPSVVGEELCNAYCNIELPLAERQRELFEYGFICSCPRCLREQVENKASRTESKRRLK